MNVPRTNKGLFNWISLNPTNWRLKKLSKEREEMLILICFVLDVLSKKWWAMCETFQKKNGLCDVEKSKTNRCAIALSNNEPRKTIWVMEGNNNWWRLVLLCDCKHVQCRYGAAREPEAVFLNPFVLCNRNHLLRSVRKNNDATAIPCSSRELFITHQHITSFSLDLALWPTPTSWIRQSQAVCLH